MTHGYCIVNMKHVDQSYWQVLIYGMRLEPDGYMTIRNSTLMHNSFNLTISYVIAFNMILQTGICSFNQYIYTYIDSLRHVSHHHIICIHDHLLVDSNVTCDGSLSRHNFPNNNTASSQYYAVQQWIYKLLWGSFDKSFT